MVAIRPHAQVGYCAWCGDWVADVRYALIWDWDGRLVESVWCSNTHAELWQKRELGYITALFPR